jgi:5-methylcytosine-specific restriction endonuclease McrA
MAEQPAHVREMERKKRARQRAANPEKARVDQTNNSALRRARLRSAPIIERVDRMVVAERDGWICQLCDGPIDPTLIFPDPWHLNVDHIVPLVKGGEHSYSNSQATHFRCNNSKRDKMPDTNRGGQRA